MAAKSKFTPGQYVLLVILCSGLFVLLVTRHQVSLDYRLGIVAATALVVAMIVPWATANQNHISWRGWLPLAGIFIPAWTYAYVLYSGLGLAYIDFYMLFVPIGLHLFPRRYRR